MPGVREHYHQHLSRFYSWMVGDFEESIHAFRRQLDELLPEGIPDRAGWCLFAAQKDLPAEGHQVNP